MRLLAVLLPLMFVAACHSTEKVDHSAASRAVHDAWGSDFESNHYDVLRTLSADEQRNLDDELSTKAGQPLHASGSIFTVNAAPDAVVQEVRKLGTGCTLSFCKTGHVDKPSGDVIGRVPYAVIYRDPDGRLHASRLEARSHEEAHFHR